MRTTWVRPAVAALGLAGAACRDEPPPRVPPRAAVMATLPRVPGSIVVDTTGTEDAERLTMVVPVSGDSVGAFYRTALEARGWSIMGDRSEGDVLDLHAVKEPGLAAWVHIERQDTASARYTVIATGPRGPAPDSAR